MNGPSGYIYKCSLNFTPKTLNQIINQLYQLEKDGLSSKTSRTFKLNKGFHSVNLLDESYGILDNYFYIKLLVSRIQEILFNDFKESNTGIDFINNPGGLKIKEVWCNILRAGDYNVPHHHQNCDISGNFYLNSLCEDTKIHETDGCLFWIGEAHNNYMIPTHPNEMFANAIQPKENLGVIFRSWKKHVVLPHFSDEDRIGIAFNSIYEKEFHYDDIQPIPYWLPIKYSLSITMNNTKHNETTIEFDKSSWYDEIECPNIKQSLKIYKILDRKYKSGETLILTPEFLSAFIKDYPVDFKKYFMH